MTEDERREMLAELAGGTKALLEALEGVTDEPRRPAPDRWSVLETVEHVAVVEEYLLARLLDAVDGEPAANPERERKIRQRAPNRSRRISAPEMLIPTGRFVTLAEATRAYLAGREQTARFVETSTGDLRARIADHPILGKVNCYEMLLMMAAHPRRHAQQIAEIRQVTSGSAPSPSC